MSLFFSSSRVVHLSVHSEHNSPSAEVRHCSQYMLLNDSKRSCCKCKCACFTFLYAPFQCSSLRSVCSRRELIWTIMSRLPSETLTKHVVQTLPKPTAFLRVSFVQGPIGVPFPTTSAFIILILSFITTDNTFGFLVVHGFLQIPGHIARHFVTFFEIH